jgi:hypothetical protein
MRRIIILLSLLSGATIPAFAQLSVGIGIGLPSISIGINFPIFPEFQPVPGYPVYYAPQLDANYFFYDGMYWVYQNDNWYASSWYNGPWAVVGPTVVPVFILRVPVQYYRSPPAYFRGWQQGAPPRWGDHWGNDWQRQRGGWDQWNHNSVPAAAPLPTYQKQYSGSRYPSVEQQRTLHSQNYRYQPHEPVVQQHYQKYVAPKAAASQQQQPQHQSQQHQQQPSGQDRPAGQSGPDRPSVQLKQDRPPVQSGQDRPAGQVENTPKQPPRSPQQQPPAQDRGPAGQPENVPRPPKQDEAKVEGGDKRQEKEEPRDNR